MRTFAVIVWSLCIVLPVRAALLVSTPSQVCSFLSDAGLVTRGWKNQYDQEFGCSSPYKELGSGLPIANNLAFYVQGTSSAVREVKLVLNVNNRAAATSAHQELLKAASSLSVKATGEQLPQTVKDAILSGSKASQQVGSSTVDIMRQDWPTGKGYEV